MTFRSIVQWNREVEGINMDRNDIQLLMSFSSNLYEYVSRLLTVVDFPTHHVGVDSDISSSNSSEREREIRFETVTCRLTESRTLCVEFNVIRLSNRRQKYVLPYFHQYIAKRVYTMNSICHVKSWRVLEKISSLFSTWIHELLINWNYHIACATMWGRVLSRLYRRLSVPCRLRSSIKWSRTHITPQHTLSFTLRVYESGLQIANRVWKMMLSFCLIR